MKNKKENCYYCLDKSQRCPIHSPAEEECKHLFKDGYTFCCHCGKIKPAELNLASRIEELDKMCEKGCIHSSQSIEEEFTVFVKTLPSRVGETPESVIADWWLNKISLVRNEAVAEYKAELRLKALKIKQKWTRPMLDTVVGEKTAEIVGTMGEHISEDFINLIISPNKE
jgi:hypothetical protein